MVWQVQMLIHNRQQVLPAVAGDAGLPITDVASAQLMIDVDKGGRDGHLHRLHHHDFLSHSRHKLLDATKDFYDSQNELNVSMYSGCDQVQPEGTHEIQPIAANLI